MSEGSVSVSASVVVVVVFSRFRFSPVVVAVSSWLLDGWICCSGGMGESWAFIGLVWVREVSVGRFRVSEEEESWFFGDDDAMSRVCFSPGTLVLWFLLSFFFFKVNYVIYFLKYFLFKKISK